jgi:hypothetical protein
MTPVARLVPERAKELCLFFIAAFGKHWRSRVKERAWPGCYDVVPSHWFKQVRPFVSCKRLEAAERLALSMGWLPEGDRVRQANERTRYKTSLAGLLPFLGASLMTSRTKISTTLSTVLQWPQHQIRKTYSRNTQIPLTKAPTSSSGERILNPLPADMLIEAADILGPRLPEFSKGRPGGFPPPPISLSDQRAILGGPREEKSPGGLLQKGACVCYKPGGLVLPPRAADGRFRSLTSEHPPDTFYSES